MPAAAEHLELAIQTGRICVYQPDPAIRWQFEP
jgi:hypothetical protein